jgi:hypothetical protein
LRLYCISVWAVLLVAALACSLAAPAFAQDRTFIEDEKRQELETTTENDQGYFFDYGGWIRYEYMTYDDWPAKEDPRNLRYPDLRLWANLRIGEEHRIYARVFTQYLDYSKGDGLSHGDHDLVGPNLDQGYYQLNLTKYLQEKYGSSSGLAFEGRVGRQLFRLGSGIVYQQVDDGIGLNFGYKDFAFQTFVSHNIKSRDDADRSRPFPGSDDTNRHFWGGEVRYKGIPRHEIFSCWLWQMDDNEEHPRDNAQDYAYDSQYFSLGATGRLIKNLRYQGEFVYERGASFPAGGTGHREMIGAWATTLGLQWAPAFSFKPRLTLEYMFGSGDEDRGSIYTAGGNEDGTKDRGFFGFGFNQTGYSLAPRLSNIHIYRLGAACNPLSAYKAFKEFEVGTSFYEYYKDEVDGPTSTAADNLEKHLGKELDFFIKWRIFSDLSTTMYYGRFFPGGAYSHDNDEEQDFFSLSLTYSF